MRIGLFLFRRKRLRQLMQTQHPVCQLAHPHPIARKMVPSMNKNIHGIKPNTRNSYINAIQRDSSYRLQLAQRKRRKRLLRLFHTRQIHCHIVELRHPIAILIQLHQEVMTDMVLREPVRLRVGFTNESNRFVVVFFTDIQVNVAIFPHFGFGIEQRKPVPFEQHRLYAV